MRTVIPVLCLLGLALAAEDNSSRKSRQILSPFDGPSHFVQPHSILDYPGQVVAPYLHPAVPTLPQFPLTASPAFPQSDLQRAVGYVRSSLQSVGGPSASFQGDSSVRNGAQNFGSQDPSVRFQQSSAGQSNDFNSQSSSNGFNTQTSANGFNAQSSSSNGLGSQGNQYSPSFPRYSSARPISASDIPPNSQPLITPTQSSQQNQGQNFPQQNPSADYNQQNPTNGQSVPQSYFRQSPQQFDSPQQSNSPFPSQARFSSQPSNQLPGLRTSQPQTQAYFANSQYSYPTYQQPSTGLDQSAAILSQSGQINYDGSYSYGFQSENGIQSSQSGVIQNVGPYSVPVVQGSYSYTAPDGTPVSARYYADHTGFHVQGSHVPSHHVSGPSVPVQQANAAVSVETN